MSAVVSDAVAPAFATPADPPMNLLDLFAWMETSMPGSPYLRESTYAFSGLLAAHVVSMCLFLGLIVMMDIRLAGIGHLRTPPNEIQKRLFAWQMLGFVLVVITGFLLFYSKPVTYYGKGFFWTKMALMLLAGLNAAFIHVVTRRDGGRGWTVVWRSSPASCPSCCGRAYG